MKNKRKLITTTMTWPTGTWGAIFDTITFTCTLDADFVDKTISDMNTQCCWALLLLLLFFLIRAINVLFNKINLYTYMYIYMKMLSLTLFLALLARKKARWTLLLIIEVKSFFLSSFCELNLKTRREKKQISRKENGRLHWAV